MEVLIHFRPSSHSSSSSHLQVGVLKGIFCPLQFGAVQCGKFTIYTLVFFRNVNAVNSICIYTLRVCWPILFVPISARFELDRQSVTQERPTSKQERLAQGNFALSRQFHLGVDRDT